jgi:CheY-like chemotaxis protein
MATIPRTPRPGGGSKRAAAKSVALVVDDEPALRELLSTVLRSQSFLAVTACSAAEALELSGRTGQRIDVLISDVQLGDGNGIDVAAQILS